MIVFSPQELATLRECGWRLAAVLGEVTRVVRPGVSTFELDTLAERLIRGVGGDPVFKGYRTEGRGKPYPAAICTSVNDEVVHAIPKKDRILASGDVLGLDLGMRWPAGQPPAASYQLPARSANGQLEARSWKPETGLVTDMAVTVPVGKVTPQAGRLISVTREALEKGIRAIRPGITLGDLGAAIQRHIEVNGFSVVRDLVGHGVGRELHEEPYVPNYGTPGEGLLIRAGMVLAVEPMATAGNPAVKLDSDGWTWRTRDGSLAAHFEHTVIVTKEGVEVLTRLS